MKLSTHLLHLLLAVSCSVISLTCDGANDSDDDNDGGNNETDDSPGAVLATGSWDGEQPDGVNFDVALFPCPFAMPPDLVSLNNPLDGATGAVSGLVAKVPPGDWCVMAYIDMDPSDGLAPVKGKDAINATGQENDNGAIPITVSAGQTTTLQLIFAI